jgi:hypothetical protein
MFKLNLKIALRNLWKNKGYTLINIAGLSIGILVAPNSAVSSEEMAVKLFGDWHKAVGQTINYRNKTDLKVTGVFADIPENSSNPIKIAIA